MRKITKKQFKNLFKIFSLLLIFDYPVLPFLSSSFFNHEQNFCEGYDISICLLITSSFILVIAVFWCVAWLLNYIIFFMEDHRNQKIKRNLLLPFYLYVKCNQTLCKDSTIRSASIALVLIILCSGALWISLYEIYRVYEVLSS